MIIEGLQKLTLLDYPQKTACTIFTGGCNFRCPFCHNRDLVLSPTQGAIDYDELLAFLRKRAGLLDGVCVTGGEPLLQHDLERLLNDCKSLGYAVKLDTNGYLPERLKSLVHAGLIDKVAMDIKNSPLKYAETAGLAIADLDKISESVTFLLQGTVDYEFRTTVVAEYHTTQDMRAIGEWIRGSKLYAIQSFVDSGAVLKANLHAPSRDEIMAYADIVRPYVQEVVVRGVS